MKIPRHCLRWMVPLLLVTGCSGGTGTADGSFPDGSGDDQDIDANGRFQACVSAPAPRDLPTVDWENFLNAALAETGADHSAQDVVAVTGQATRIPGKFAYGPTSKDLEGEWIEVLMDDCAGTTRSLGQARTDSDGRIALELAAGDLPPVGAYALHLRVMGDNTSARSVLRVLPPGTRLMIFDIDGTLTTDDLELVGDVMADLFGPILAGDYVPAARAGAVEITRLRRDTQGYVLVYLTGRPYLMTELSRGWLEELGFAPGSLHLCDDMADTLPSDDAVGDYKAGYLGELLSAGLVIEAAYGNASTDVYAYDRAGVPLERTFILGENGGAGGTADLGDDYLGHLPDARLEPAASQPFAW
jgi:phosphatidate phosphatase PAH1